MWAYHLSQLLVPPKCENEDDSLVSRLLVHHNAVTIAHEL